MQSESTEAKAVTLSPVEIEVTVQVDDLRSNWKRISFLANYFAEYVAYDLPQRDRAENLLSTITNEILEAVVRLAPERTNMRVRCTTVGNGLSLDVEHYVKTEFGPSYVLFVENLGENKNEEAYLQFLTSDVKPEENFNQLGLMILGYDFDVQLSLRMEQGTEQFCTHVDVQDEVLSK